METNNHRIALLENMVSIRSHSGEESDIASYLVDYMKSAGFDSFIDGAGNAVGVKGKSSALKQVVLLGHMDTVSGEVPFRREGNILYGRGSVDAKGPLATFISAVAEVEPGEDYQLIVIGAVEEEASSSKGARFVIGKYKPIICLIGEPSGYDAVTVGYKGRLLIRADLEISCSHTASSATSAAERGVLFWNNILQFREKFNSDRKTLFSSLLSDLRHFNTETDGLCDHVGISGGFRLPPDFDLTEFEEYVRSYDPAFKVAFSGHEQAYSSDPRSGLVRHFTTAIRAHGKRPRIKYKTGTSDMNVVGPAWKCPILAYGPGDSSLDHKPNEHILLDEYEGSIQILKKSLLSITNEG